MVPDTVAKINCCPFVISSSLSHQSLTGSIFSCATSKILSFIGPRCSGFIRANVAVILFHGLEMTLLDGRLISFSQSLRCILLRSRNFPGLMISC
jgi:hypothetical protein